MLKIEYGDNSIEMYNIQINETDDLSTMYKFRVRHVYTDKSKSSFTIKATIANHLQKQEVTKSILFENSIPIFRIVAQQNLTDFSQLATFSISPLVDTTTKPNLSIEVNQIRVLFDASNQSSLFLINGYTFNKSNSFSLNLTNRYSRYGMFKISVNCSNTISFSLAETAIKVGTDLTSATGLITKGYVNINDDAELFIRVKEGNKGYQILINFGNSKSMLLPWTYISSNGSFIATTFTIIDHVPIKARFASNGIYVSYAYSAVGTYDVTVNISNPFNSLSLRFCSKIFVQPDRSSEVSIDGDSNCLISDENLRLNLNSLTLDKLTATNLARGNLILVYFVFFSKRFLY
jgi:hypothetical protein